MIVACLYMIAGIVAYASIHHFAIAFKSPRKSLQLLFAVMCALSVVFAMFQALNMRSANVAEFADTLRVNLAAILLFLTILPWFIGLYAGNMKMPVMAGLSLFFAVLTLANFALPATLQYSHIDGIYTQNLPWGEAVTRANGEKGVWSYIAFFGFAVEFGYVMYTLGAVYRAEQRREDFWMFVAFLILLGSMLEGILVRWQMINFIETGPLGFLATVIVMSVALTSEMLQRMRASESNFRSLFDNSPTAILAVDSENHRIVQANDIAVEMFGYSFAEMLKKSFDDLTGQDTPDVQECFQNYELLSKGVVKYLYCEKTFRRKDGSSFTALVSSSSLRNEEGTALRFIHSLVDITKQKQAISALQESEIRFRTIIEQSPIGLVLGRDGVIVEANDVFLQMYGFGNVSEVLGQPIISHIAPQCRTEVEERIRRRALGEDTEPSYETVGLRADGSQFPVHISARRVELEDGPMTCAFEIDITARKNAEADLRIAAIALESNEGMLIADAQNVILKVNRSFSEITGYSAEEVIGRNPHILSSGLQDAEFYATMWKSLKDVGVWEGEIWNRRKNGEIYPERLTVTAVKDAAGNVTNYVAAFTDITESMAAAEKINHLAFYDHLTELPNQKLLMDRLHQALASSSRNGRHGAVLFIDLNDFKSLNDTLGHATGDAVLKQVALRLSDIVRKGDTVSRFGGDEFVVILDGLSSSSLEAAEQTEAACSKIFSAMQRPIQLGAHEYQCSISVGATLFGKSEQSIEELLKQADIALHHAKRAERNSLRFFDRRMQEVLDSRTALESELHQAVKTRQFSLYYQIQMHSSGYPVGAEALIRWHHPERGIITPSQFIPLAEEMDLILPIGEWVIESACSKIKEWEKDVAKRELVMSVNISAKQLHLPDFAAQMIDAVKRHGIDPRKLKLEITESMLLENIETTISVMNELRKAGLRFSLDDFGTGYSSLQYLKMLPLDQLKIDQSFIRDIVTDGNDQAIVRTIIAMSKSLNLDVIAEGVETPEQQRFLEACGCNHYQGYLFGKPSSQEIFDTACLCR